MEPQLDYRGQHVSPGIAHGPAFLLHRERKVVPHEAITSDQIETQLKRLENALNKTRMDLQHSRRKAMRTLGKIVARIFDAHLMILDDEPTFDSIREAIREELISPEYSLYRTLEMFAKSFDMQKDDIFRERAQDVRDVLGRLLAHLTGKDPDTISSITRPSVLIAEELNPSDVLQIDPEMVLAVATEAGGATSHTAILTRSLGVPSVVGLSDLMDVVEPGDLVIVNGNSGRVLVRPDDAAIVNYLEKEAKYKEFIHSLTNIKDKPAITLDGHHIELAANIELPDEVKRVIAKGGDGVGLFRTEYLVLARGELPSEEMQFAEFKRAAEILDGKPLVIRSFDLGGDKAFPGSGIPEESNPFMGWRAIRVALDREEMLMPQLKALLRASHYGNISLMFPMISQLEELKAALEKVELAKQELRSAGIPFDKEMPVGMMVEVPSVALMADIYAPFVDFFSVGTNDLVQFTLAVDRCNHQVSDLHDPFHPAVLQLIKMTVDAGHHHQIPTSLCGEFAGDPLATLLLMGIGLDEFSTSPSLIPEIKKLILSSSFEDARNLADEALRKQTATDVREFLLHEMKQRFKDMPIWFGKKNGD